MTERETESIDFFLAQLCKAHRARAHALLEQLDLYQGQPHLLFVLWEKDGLRGSDLAEQLHVRHATITRMVQRMEKAGFVESRPDPEDQRVSRVFLTDAGRAVRAQVDAVWSQLETETFVGFTPEERVLLRGFFLRMRENLLLKLRDTPSPG